jgi:hypothetical protein
MIDRLAKIRYEQILTRSFKSDVNLFLFENVFSKKDKGKIIKEDYEKFKSNPELEEKYLFARQLSKDEMIIEYKGVSLKVKYVDDLFKEWYNNNDILIEYKEIFRTNRFISFEDFLSFYNNDKERQCYYCGLTESMIESLIEKNKIYTKRLLIRGRKLEVDKRNPNGKYDKENMVLCCYWCNNAKSDEFSFEEFKPIGNAIKQIWEKRS